MIVIDASALLTFLLEGSTASVIDERLANPRSLHAPHLIDAEITYALRRQALRGQLPPARCQAALEDLAESPLRRYRHTPLLPRVWQLRFNISTYDAMYVALAEYLDIPLLTRDRRLAAAPGHRARIELV